jgi:voltage-dependent calcium channel T type alpha-1G
MLFYLLFGIFGINFFKGAFYYCYNMPFVENKQECMDLGGDWVNNMYTFDNIG